MKIVESQSTMGNTREREVEHTVEQLKL